MVQDSSQNGPWPEIISEHLEPPEVIGGTGGRREGKGFSEKEIKEAGLWSIKDLLPFDKRRKSCHEFNVQFLLKIKDLSSRAVEEPSTGEEEVSIAKSKFEELQEQASKRSWEMIPIEDLDVDITNARQGIWNYDEELANSVKENGIELPLLVRPVEDSGAKFGVVCGSRRYNAAISAGLEEVPCKIREMNDAEAMNRSLQENYQREDTPKWMDIEQVGRQYHEVLDGSHEEKIEKIAEIGMNKGTIERYLRIYGLSDEVKGLLRKPNGRTDRQSEYLLNFSRRPRDKLSVTRADFLADLQGSLPKNKLFKAGIYMISMSVDNCEKFATLLNKNPDLPLHEVRDQVYEEEYKKHDVGVRVDHGTKEALDRACMDKQIYYGNLIRNIITEWLEREGYC